MNLSEQNRALRSQQENDMKSNYAYGEKVSISELNLTPWAPAYRVKNSDNITVAYATSEEVQKAIVSSLNSFDAMREALEKIKHKCRPGQELDAEGLADIVCEILNESSAALKLSKK